MDCNNATLYGLPAVQYNRLQRMFNIAARILTLTKRTEHITPILRSLHWLPIEKRVQYKILLLTFKTVHNLAPPYLCELIKPYTNARHLRSSSMNLLHVPKTRTKTFGDRAFSVAAPVLWNALPASVRSIDSVNVFKKRLKTILFNDAYS